MISTPWTWQFPPYANPPRLRTQIVHVELEAAEAENALTDEEPPERVAEELMDVIHSAETALRLLPFDEAQLDAIKRGVVEKNQRRGYYGGDE